MRAIDRREFCAGLAGLAAISLPDTGNAQSPGSTIALITSLGDLLGKSADAISKLGDSVAHIVHLGTQGYDAVAARKTHADLLALRGNLEGFVATSNRPTMRSIDDYLSRQRRSPKPTPLDSERAWHEALDKIRNATERANALLTDVRAIRNDFVLENAYRSIQQALSGRISLLTRLSQLPPPRTSGELKALEGAAAEYHRLSDATLKASEQLAAYIKTLKQE